MQLSQGKDPQCIAPGLRKKVWRHGFFKIFQLYCATYLDLSKLSTLQQCNVFGEKNCPVSRRQHRAVYRLLNSPNSFLLRGLGCRVEAGERLDRLQRTQVESTSNFLSNSPLLPLPVKKIQSTFFPFSSLFSGQYNNIIWLFINLCNNIVLCDKIAQQKFYMYFRDQKSLNMNVDQKRNWLIDITSKLLLSSADLCPYDPT